MFNKKFMYVLFIMSTNNLFSIGGVFHGRSWDTAAVNNRYEEQERSRRNADRAKEIENFLAIRYSKILEILQKLTNKISNQELDNLLIESITTFSSECVIKALELGASKIEQAKELIQANHEYSGLKIIADEKELITSLLNAHVERAKISKEYLNKIILPDISEIVIDYLVGFKIKNDSKCSIL